MATLPPLPQIVGDGDLLLDIYTHKSLVPGGAPMNEEYGDTDRLADLGARVLDLAVTFHFHSKRPMLLASEIAQQRAQAISDEDIEHWLTVYGIRQNLLFAPSESASVGSPDGLRRLFHTYIGALHIRSGMHAIQRWISQLIDPDTDAVFEPLQPRDFGQNLTAPPPPPPGPPPPLPGHSTNVPSGFKVTLGLINETAAKKRVTVTYPAERAGEDHQLTWTVKCCVNDTEQGRGVGTSKKAAKEEAAQRAWINMGW